jgi:hypothetical protein
MDKNYLDNILVKDPDNLQLQLTLKEYIDMYTKQHYSVLECMDYLLKKGQIEQIDLNVINELCIFYNYDKNELKEYYKQYIKDIEVDIEDSKSESEISELSSIGHPYCSSQTESVEEVTTSEVQQLNEEQEKLKNDIKKILGKTHKDKINNIHEQIDALFNDILEKEVIGHRNDYNYIIKNNESQIKRILNNIEFTCRQNRKQVEENQILEIKKLVFKAIIDKSVKMYNNKKEMLLSIAKINKIKHFEDLVRLSNNLGILYDRSRKFGSELEDFCKISCLNEKLKIDGNNIKIEINNNTYSIIKDNAVIGEIQKSNKKNVFVQVSKINNTSKVRIKANEIDVLSRISEAIDEINSIRQISNPYNVI